MYPFFWTVSEKRGTYQAKKGTNAGMKALRGLSVSFVSFVYRAKSREREDNKNAA